MTQARNSRRFPDAFTFAEVVVLLVVLVIMAILVLPSGDVVADTQLASAAQLLESDIHAIRRLAASGEPGKVYALVFKPKDPVTDAREHHMHDALALADSGFGGMSIAWPRAQSALDYLAAASSGQEEGEGEPDPCDACIDNPPQ